MKKLLTEPEKDVEALLRNDTIRRHQEKLRQLLAEREAQIKLRNPSASTD
jgi:3-methyladenine DNA glycosylase Tag